MGRTPGRLRLFTALVALMFAALTARLWSLQVLAAPQYARDVREQSLLRIPLPANRGLIVDARGKTLVRNQLSLQVLVNRQELGDDTESVLLNLSEVLDVPVRRLSERLATKQYYLYQPVPVAGFIGVKKAAFIREHPERFPPRAVQVVERAVREYPQGRTAAHILGHLGQIDTEELKAHEGEGYGLNDQIGKSGLEASYESYLRGEAGEERHIVNADGEFVGPALPDVPPVDGDKLVLALDLEIQRLAEQELEAGLARSRSIYDEDTGRYLEANGGAVVVMNANTGGVVAMASWPDFDPRWYVDGLTRQQRRYLFESGPKLSPSSNRATQFPLSPGSTFKPFILLSALRHGIASWGSYYDCPAEYVAPFDESGTSYRNSFPADFGLLSISEALMRSCDTIFYHWGWQFWDRWRDDQLGKNAEPLQKDLRALGFARPTGIDLPSESTGVLFGAADAAEHPELFYKGLWQPGGDILISIGSSYVTVTPLQLARAYSAIASGGRLCTPHLVDRIVDAAGNTVENVRPRCKNLGYPKGWMDNIRAALTRVTAERGGTAYYTFSGYPHSEVPVAGKTGTALRGQPGWQDTSWFAAMVPANDPQYVVVAMAEQGGFGSETAAPIVRGVIEGIYGLRSAGGPIRTGGTE
jgi:penicillin-binding protein 2